MLPTTKLNDMSGREKVKVQSKQSANHLIHQHAGHSQKLAVQCIDQINLKEHFEFLPHHLHDIYLIG